MESYKQFFCIHSIISEDRFCKVLDEILSLYNNVSYHSAKHGLDVMNTGYNLLMNSKVKESMTQMDILTYIFALLGHDAGHPGLGNHEEIKRIYALFPTSDSPLEEYHYYHTQVVLRSNGIDCNYKLLKSIILATDPKMPISIISTIFPEKLKGLVPLIKLADVNHAISFFDKHCEWSYRLVSELYGKMNYIDQIRFLEGYVGCILHATENVIDNSLYEQFNFNLKSNIDYWNYKQTIYSMRK